MVNRVKLISSISAGWLLLVTGLFAETVFLDGVAARVNKDVITVGEVVRMMMPAQQDLVQNFKGEALNDKLRQLYGTTLNSLIERRIILDAYSQQDMKIPEWVVDERIEEVIKDNFKADRDELMSVLARERISFSDWRQRWKERMIIASMRSSFVVRNINVSPSEIRERYEQDKKKYWQPEQVKLRMIYIKPGDDSSAVAEEVVRKLSQGIAFEALAKEHSEGRLASDGGDWGWVEPGILRKEISQAISKLDVGSVSGIIETSKGLYIVKLEGRKEEKAQSLESVRADIEDELRAEQGERLYQEWIKRLRSDAYVKIEEIDLFSGE